MNRKTARALSMLFGGTAGGLFFDGRIFAGTVLGAVMLAAALQPELDPFVRKWRARGLAALSFVYPVAPLTPGRAAKAGDVKHAQVGLDALRQTIGNAGEVSLLLASGWKFVGPPRFPGWLHSTLTAGNVRRLEVLLLDPGCPAAVERAKETLPRHTHENYKAGTGAVLWTLAQWSIEYDIDIEVRLYTDEPIWQMIILPDDLWLLVAADGRSTETSPLYVFRRNEPYGLAHGLEAVWRRRWGQGRPVDLGDVREPERKLLVDDSDQTT